MSQKDREISRRFARTVLVPTLLFSPRHRLSRRFPRLPGHSCKPFIYRYTYQDQSKWTRLPNTSERSEAVLSFVVAVVRFDRCIADGYDQEDDVCQYQRVPEVFGPCRIESVALSAVTNYACWRCEVHTP